jgi:hypothetical protein
MSFQAASSVGQCRVEMDTVPRSSALSETSSPAILILRDFLLSLDGIETNAAALPKSERVCAFGAVKKARSLTTPSTPQIGSDSSSGHVQRSGCVPTATLISN